MKSMFVVTLTEAIGLIFYAAVLSMVAIFIGSRAWRQFRCKHDGSIGETSACDAICHKCGKNLGFIGNWRGKERQQ